MCDGAGGCQFVDLWLGSAHLLSGHRANFANPRLAETTETTETTGQIGAGIENTHCYTLSTTTACISLKARPDTYNSTFLFSVTF